MSGNPIHDNERVSDTRITRVNTLIEDALDVLDNLGAEIANNNLEAARVALWVAQDHLTVFSRQL